MVGTEKITNTETNITNGIETNHLSKTDYNHITVLDLSNRNISNLSEELDDLPNITHLNISHNNLTEVPKTVMNLSNLVTLDISYNAIIFFDDPPSFCDTIEKLDLSNNKLEGPPLWIWVEKPRNLTQLNISNNESLCQSLVKGYFEELLQYTTLVSEIDVHNCKLKKHLNLMATCCNARVISLGCKDYYLALNQLDHVPCAGLDKCLDVEKLYLSNTQIYDIKSNIDIYKNLKELNLSQNYINSLPNEFSNLENLQICILTGNKLLYLPENLNKLSKLVKLYLDNNELCMLPDNLHELSSLKTLDLYNNYICDGFDFLHNLEELDLAQNYFEEPDEVKYLMKKKKLRQNCVDRLDGQKMEAVKDDSEYSKDETDDEESYNAFYNGCQEQSFDTPGSRSSTPEDWDSDDYWIPQINKQTIPPSSRWLFFVKKKMEEGNFCPMDAHPISISEKVKYEKMMNPQPGYESEGQFDDYSDDDS